jgi:NitT/TauT family transport system ATP-binding protein
MNAEHPFIVIDRVTKSYKGRLGPSEALRETSIQISRGEFVCVVGPSGCGKTTILNMLAGFVEPTTGRIEVAGQEVKEPGPDRGVVFQEVGLFSWLTARRNVEFGLTMKGMPLGDRHARAEAVLELTGMLKFADRFPNELSGGMKQRVGLARALAPDPDVLLMDEPFAALDAQSRSLMQQEVLKIWAATGKTILFVTHAVDEALLLADRVIVMSANPGRVKEGIQIDLPRPRDDTSESFTRLEKSLRDMILAEARAIEFAE